MPSHWCRLCFVYQDFCPGRQNWHFCPILTSVVSFLPLPRFPPCFDINIILEYNRIEYNTRMPRALCEGVKVILTYQLCLFFLWRCKVILNSRAQNWSQLFQIHVQLYSGCFGILITLFGKKINSKLLFFWDVTT